MFICIGPIAPVRSQALKSIAMHTGLPQDGERCTASPLTIGDTIVPFDIHGREVSVTDINTVWYASAIVGWLYRGSDGYTYLQRNPPISRAWPPAFLNGVGSAGFGAADEPGASRRWDIHEALGPGVHTLGCWKQGWRATS